jgi:hypothetical protein
MKAEGRGRKAEARPQMADSGRQTTDDRGQREGLKGRSGEVLIGTAVGIVAVKNVAVSAGKGALISVAVNSLSDSF